jgi:hypothetical protein
VTTLDEAALFERQVLLLKRYWELLEGLKQHRTRLPILVCTMLLGITGFVLNSGSVPSSRPQAVGIATVLLVITATGVWVGAVIHRRYEFVDERISHLYRQMGITGIRFFLNEDSALEASNSLFIAIYVVMILIGVICSAGILLAPLPPAAS